MAVDQAVKTPQQKGLLPAIDAGWGQALQRSHNTATVRGAPADQLDGDALYPAHIIALIGVLKSTVEVF